MNDKDDDTTAEKLSEIIDTIADTVEENQDLIDKAMSVVGVDSDGKTVSIADMDELSEMRSKEDMVEIVAETKMDGIGSIGVTKETDRIEIDLGEKKIIANDVPDDLDVGNAVANLNNGVMTVQIPRKDDVESTVTDKEGDL